MFFYTQANGDKCGDVCQQQMGAGMKSDELVIHRASVAALAAPLAHPAHLQLWQLFMYLYLQRPPASPLVLRQNYSI